MAKVSLFFSTTTPVKVLLLAASSGVIFFLFLGYWLVSDSIHLQPVKSLTVLSVDQTTGGLMPTLLNWASKGGSVQVWRLKPSIKVKCKNLYLKNRTEIKKVKDNMELTLDSSEEDLLANSKNCSWIQEYFNNRLYVTDLEKNFSIAFSFLVHNSAPQIVRLLRLLYRPHNQYIFAPDLKSKPVFVSTFRNIALCVSNVHVVSKLSKVQWGHKSIIETQMQMYSDLMKLRETQEEHERWKYVINLCGKELPLHSNHEIVARLAKLNAASIIGARKIPPTEGGTISRLKKKTIPYALPLYKSMTYMGLSFEFINFLFTNSNAVHLYEFFKTCEIPEEHYYATLYRIPNVPGGYNPDIKERYFNIDNYFWRTNYFGKEDSRRCSGRTVHNICIVDVGDLNRTLEEGRGSLFHNKYFMEYDHVIMDCMEEKIRAQNQLERRKEKEKLKHL